MFGNTTLRLIGSALRKLWQRTDRAELGMVAASVAFFGFLAIFPAVAAVIAIWGFAADPHIVPEQLAFLREFLPADVYALLKSQVDSLMTANNRQLGWTTLFSTLFALWSARAGLDALIRGLNAIYHLPNRNGLHHIGIALLMTLTLVAISLAALMASVVVPLVLNYLPLGTAAAITLQAANLALGAVIVVIGLALTYRFGPNRSRTAPRPAFFTPGLLLALILWALVSRGFVVYIARFNSYNHIYGSIGAVAALMMWLYLTAYAVLLGAAVDAERAAPNQ